MIYLYLCVLIFLSSPPVSSKTRRTFIGSFSLRANEIGGRAGGDQKCQTLANNENLGGNWRILISDDALDLKDQIGKDSLVSILNTPLSGPEEIGVDEAGRPINVVNTMWTGSTAGGINIPPSFTISPSTNSQTAITYNCSNWTQNGTSTFSGLNFAAYGTLTNTLYTGIDQCGAASAGFRLFMCIED